MRSRSAASPVPLVTGIGGKRQHTRELGELSSEGALTGICTVARGKGARTQVLPPRTLSCLSLLRTSCVQRVNQSARRAVTPSWKDRWRSSKPTQETKSPPEVFLHDSGTPETEHRRKKRKSATRKPEPPASRWKSSATRRCHVRAVCPARYWVSRPSAEATRDHQ